MADTHGQIPFVAYDADGRIDQDLPCVKCGYNLRTMRDDGQCPECGASVGESARLAWLCQHDPVWLRRLARATVWMVIAMVCLAGLPVLGLWLLLGGPEDDTLVPCCLAALASGAVSGLHASSELTAPHSAGAFQRRVRGVARWALAAGLISLLALVGLVLLLAEARRPGVWIWVVPALALSVTVSLGVGVWAMLVYAADLAAKIPEARLVKQLGIVAWAFALCFLALCATVMMLLAEELVAAGVNGVFEPTALVTCAALLILSIWTIALLVPYRRRLLEALAMSQQRAKNSGS